MLDINEMNCVDIFFLKNTPLLILMKIRHVIAELFHMGARTDGQSQTGSDTEGRRLEVNSPISQFCERA
jgi:hypothetical protein